MAEEESGLAGIIHGKVTEEQASPVAAMGLYLEENCKLR